MFCYLWFVPFTSILSWLPLSTTYVVLPVPDLIQRPCWWLAVVRRARERKREKKEEDTPSCDGRLIYFRGLFTFTFPFTSYASQTLSLSVSSSSWVWIEFEQREEDEERRRSRIIHLQPGRTRCVSKIRPHVVHCGDICYIDSFDSLSRSFLSLFPWLSFCYLPLRVRFVSTILVLVTRMV